MSHLPLAAFQQFDLLLEVVFFLVMGFLWLVNRISAAVETARRPPPARRPMPPNVPPNVPQGDAPDAAPQQAQGQAAARPRPPVQQAPARAGSESLQNEIEEFLRRAANRGNPQPAGQQQRPRMPSPRPAVTGAKGDSRRARGVPVVVRPKQTTPVPPQQGDTPEAIAQHVKQFLDTREFTERSSMLSSIDEKEKQFDRNIQKAFTHELGHLKPSTLADGGESSAAASIVAHAPVDVNSLVGLFRTNADMKRAILLNEIFQRPEQRW